MNSEDRKDILFGLKRVFLIALPVMLLIAVLGSAVNAPGWAVPAATVVWGSIGYFGTKGAKKEKLKATAGWGGLAFVFTLIAVLCS